MLLAINTSLYEALSRGPLSQSRRYRDVEQLSAMTDNAWLDLTTHKTSKYRFIIMNMSETNERAADKITKLQLYCDLNFVHRN